MAAKTHYSQSQVLSILKGTNVTAPGTFYVGLFTAAPTDAGGGTEVSTSGTAYARQAVSWGTVVSNGASPGDSLSNNALITFPTATASWGTVTSFGIFDAASGGNLWYYGNLSSSQAVTTGNIIAFPSTSITINEG